jgi:hypothetical protein
MTNYRRYSVIFGILGGILIASGMFLQNVYMYSPSIGWIGGLVSFLLAAYFGTKAKNESKDSSNRI